MSRAADQRARYQRRERFVRKRSESAARDIWAALVTKAARPNWSKWAGILRGLHVPQCGCVQCGADALTEQAEINLLNSNGGKDAKNSR